MGGMKAELDPPVQIPKRLRLYNSIAGTLHLLQGIVVLILATDFSLPVIASYPTGPPGAFAFQQDLVFEFSIAWGAAAFLFMSAIAHFTIISPGVWERYTQGLKEGRNYYRWVEYAFSSTLMVVLIALLTGIIDISALIAIAGANVAMILFGLVQEKYESPGEGNSLISYWFGCIAGIVPWLAIGWYLISPGFDSVVPGFVIGIFISLFLFFNSFAIVMVLQQKKIGRWSNYAVGEMTYVTLSLVAKSALAWQVFGGTLAG